jgi:hypothetical protein
MNDETTTTVAPRLQWHESNANFLDGAGPVSTSLLLEMAVGGLCAAVGLYWQRSKVGDTPLTTGLWILDVVGGGIAGVGVLLLLWVVARVSRSAWHRWQRPH